MALLGAEKVIGVDVSASGIEVARSFSEGVKNVEFVQASALDLPFPSESFDFVCCAGVLHHTPSVERGLDEIARVLKPEGKAFVLLYGAGGLRWKLVTALRPIALELGASTVDAAIRRIGLPANNRKHFMDDFFVPIQTFINWEALESLLVDRGFVSVERWTEGRFDHEAKPQSQIEDMEKIRSIFKAIFEFSDDSSLSSSLGRLGFDFASAFINEAELCLNDALRKPKDVERLIIGEGNHRVIATFGSSQ